MREGRRPATSAVAGLAGTRTATPAWPRSDIPQVETTAFPNWVVGRTGGAATTVGAQVALDSMRHLLFVVPGAFVYTYDVSDPVRPRLLSQVILPTHDARGCSLDATLARQHLYVLMGCSRDELLIVDIADPEEPEFRGVASELAALPSEEVDQGVQMGALAAADGRLLVANEAGLSALDIALPARPRLVWNLTLGEPVASLDTSGDGALMLTFRGTLGVIDVEAATPKLTRTRSPSSRTIAASVAVGEAGATASESDGAGTGGESDGGAVSVVAVGETGTTLETHRVARPPSGGAPSLVEIASVPYDTALPLQNRSSRDDYYEDDWWPGAAVRAGQFYAVGESQATAQVGVVADGEWLGDRSRVRLLDVTDPELPALAGQVELPGGNVRDLIADAGTIYASLDNGTSGVDVVAVDVSDAGGPRLSGSIVLPAAGGAPRVGPDGELVVSGVAFDISEPARPRPATSSGVSWPNDWSVTERIETAGRPVDALVEGELAFVTHTGPGTRDVKFMGPDPGEWLTVVEGAGSPGARTVVDVSVADLAEMNGIDVGYEVTGMSASGGRVALSIGGAWLDPATPVGPPDLWMHNKGGAVLVLPAKASIPWTGAASTEFGPVGAIALDGCTLYVRQGESSNYYSMWGGSLFAADVCSEPGQITILDEMPMSSWAPGTLVPDGDDLYVADDMGVLVVNAANPRALAPVRRLAAPPGTLPRYFTPGSVFPGVVRLGSHLYVGGGELGLLVAEAR